MPARSRSRGTLIANKQRRYFFERCYFPAFPTPSNALQTSLLSQDYIYLAFAVVTSHAAIPVETLRQGCRAMLSGGHGAAAVGAMFSIRTWIKAVPEAASKEAQAKSDPAKALFREAENPLWCAASIEKFIVAHQDSLPEGLSDTELLPIWWASVHPAADETRKEWAKKRLKELGEQRTASAARK